MGKDYIGQDISRRKLAESRKLVDYLRLAQANYVQLPHIQLKYADPAKDHGKYECLFTYLPRYNKELWPDLPKADFTADQLIDICLNNYQCQRYLFIVDETVKYQDYVVETFEKSSFLGIEYEYLVLIDR